MQNKYEIQEGQTLLDIAIHNYGSMEAAFELAARNDLGLTDVLLAGTNIDLPAEQINRYVLAAIQNRNMTPRTAPDIAAELGGIGHMQIWVSFKVG